MYTPENYHDNGKSPFFNRRYIFNLLFFHCHVSFSRVFKPRKRCEPLAIWDLRALRFAKPLVRSKGTWNEQTIAHPAGTFEISDGFPFSCECCSQL